MKFASVNGQVIHYADSGNNNGPALVLINSLGTDFRIWEPVRKAFSDRFRIITYDKRGHGLSSAPPAPYRMDDHRDDLVALMDHLSVNTAILCGVSVGGVIAQSVTLAVPDRVRALVLCDTAAKIGNDDLWNGRIAAVERDGIEAIADSVLERWFSPDYHRHQSRMVTGWRHMLTRTPVAGYAGTSAALRDCDLTTASRAITQPALALAGEHDGATPPQLVKSLADILANCRFELVRECGHLPSIEQPAVLIELVDGFFVEHDLM